MRLLMSPWLETAVSCTYTRKFVYLCLGDQGSDTYMYKCLCGGGSAHTGTLMAEKKPILLRKLSSAGIGSPGRISFSDDQIWGATQWLSEVPSECARHK